MAKPTIPDGPRAAYSIDQTCDAFGGVSRDWLYRQIREGRIQSVKLGGRRFIPAGEIERIAKGGGADAATA